MCKSMVLHEKKLNCAVLAHSTLPLSIPGIFVGCQLAMLHTFPRLVHAPGRCLLPLRMISGTKTAFSSKSRTFGCSL